MYYSKSSLLGILAIIITTTTTTHNIAVSAASPPTPTLLHHFDPSVRIENLTILPNSTIIVCNAFNGTLFGLNPLDEESPEPYFITSFLPETDAIFGLASPTPNTIAATANNFTWDTTSPNFGPSPGSNVVHLVTLPSNNPSSSPPPPPPAPHHPHARHDYNGEEEKEEEEEAKEPTTRSFPIPTAAWLNGLTPVPSFPDKYLLVADCYAGSLIRLDLSSGDYQTVIAGDPLFAPIIPGSDLPIGINGIHMSSSSGAGGGHDHHFHWLYFTNTDLGIYGRVALTPEGLSLGGSPAQVVVNGTGGSTFDDFALLSLGLSSKGKKQKEEEEEIGFLATGLGGANGIERVIMVDGGSGGKVKKTDMVASWELGSEEFSQPVSAVVDPRSGIVEEEKKKKKKKKGRGGEGEKIVVYFATAGEYLGSGVPATGAQVFKLEVDEDEGC